MFLQILKSKIHRVQVTEANLEYIGSITIDEDLMDAAAIVAGERVQVVDNNNGARLETYVIPGKRGSGCVCMNGAAAHLIHGSSDGRFMITYAVKEISQQEIADVGFQPASYDELAKKYDPETLKYACESACRPAGPRRISSRRGPR